MWLVLVRLPEHKTQYNMIKLGTNNIGRVYLGTNAIGKAYLGSDLVYQIGGTPTPPTPTGLVFYDWLVFDGTAYIDTDIIPDANASYRSTFGGETLKATQRLFQVPAANSTLIGVIYGTQTTTTNRVFSVYYGASNAVSTGKSLAFSYDTYGFFLTPKRFGWPNNVYTITKGENAPTGPLVIGYNAAHQGQAYTGKVNIFRVYGSDAQNATSPTDLMDNYTPAYTLRPCTYNSEAGLWCVETDTFYGNTAGAGTLTVQNNP